MAQDGSGASPTAVYEAAVAADEQAEEAQPGDEELTADEDQGVSSDPDANEVAKERLAELGAGDDDQQGDDEGDESADDDVGEAIDGGKPKAPSGKQIAGDKGKDGAADGGPKVLTDVEIPPIRSETPGGQARAAAFTLTNLPQEAADQIRHIASEYRRIPALEAAVAESDEVMGIMELIGADAPAAMMMMQFEGEKAGKDPGLEFVKEYIRRYPDKVSDFLTEEELDKLDARGLRAISSKAQADMEGRIRKGLGTIQQGASKRVYDRQASTVIMGLLDGLGIDPDTDDGKEFTDSAQVILDRARQDQPRMSAQQMRAKLERLTGRYTPRPQAKAKDAKSTGKQVAPTDVMKKKRQIAQIHGRLGPGQQVRPPLGHRKAKTGETLEEASARLRRE